MNLGLVILQTLESVLPTMMARGILISQLRLMGRKETESEIDRELRTLEGRKQLTALTAEDAPGGYRYKATADGVVRLREAGL